MRAPGRNLERNIQRYLEHRVPNSRYTSFDYCFNYFQALREQRKLKELTGDRALQLSCLHLGFYLASWGMFRGSTDLLKRSVRHLIPLARAISEAPREIWDMDANVYGDGSCSVVFHTADRIRKALPGSSDTLVTKIMLGTFGCIPAFDTNFRKGSGIRRFEPDSLRRLADFYSANSRIIESNRARTIEFTSGKPTKRRYTRAKVIDMIFFVQGS